MNGMSGCVIPVEMSHRIAASDVAKGTASSLREDGEDFKHDMS